MNSDAGYRGIMLSANINNCAHNCRYCLVGEHERGTLIPFDSFAPFAEKFVAWREAGGALNVFINMRYSFECPVERLDWFIRQRARCGQTMNSLLLGGLVMRQESDTTAWLAKRRDIGIGTVIASFAGTDSLHDYWNGRTGDFEHLLLLLRSANALGIRREERMFVNRASLPVMDGLMARLDALPGKPAVRSASLFMYRGLAAELESVRITARERDALPDNLKKLAGNFAEWRSEAEWIDRVLNTDETSAPRLMHLSATAANVSELGTKSCDEIVDDLKTRTSAAYAAIPTRRELCKAVGNRSSDLVYGSVDSIERLWLDRYLDTNPVRFERNLTHLSTW